MSETFKVALIQNCAQAEVAHNLAETLAMSRQAAAEGAQLICLPEYFSPLGVSMGSEPSRIHAPVSRARSRKAGSTGCAASL